MTKLTGPIPNPFRAFNNMTYGISMYLQSPEKYTEMLETGNKDVKGMELLVQSGGISDKAEGNFGAKRNEFFTRDFYLNDIQLQSLIAGTATGGPHNSFELNFTVTEPMGLSFMDRLYKASTKYNSKYKNFNPINQIYLIVIRFYGYDKNGKQVLNGKFDDGSDTNSYIEKWVPIMIKSIKFRVETSKVVYACECVCPQTQIGQGQIHGTIPFSVGLQGQKLSDLLDGTEKKPVKGIVNSGLMDALNKHQQKLVTDKKIKIANKYSIKFEDGIKLKDAKVAAPGTKVIQKSGTAGGATATDISKYSSGSAQSINGVQTYATNAGMKIMKFIDLAVRSSTYVSDQYKKVNEENKDGTTKHKPKSDQPLKWYKIRNTIKIIDFDEIRQQWAYDITYYVTAYEVKTVETVDFNSADCFKVHKEYDFWFTGKNTEVLDFSQEFNTFYYTSFSPKHIVDPSKDTKRQNNLRAMLAPRANSTESNAHSENMGTEQGANAASVLYAPQDIANVKIDILGDPDWLSQSELFYAASTTPSDPILADGSINYDIAEVFFAVNFNTVVDYNLETGLADVTAKNLGRDITANESGVSQYSFLYRANTITTQFNDGKFTQQILGTLVFIPEECITGKKPDDTNKGSL